MNIDRQALKNKYQTEQVYVVPFGTCSNIKDKFQSAEMKLNYWDSAGKYVYRYDAEYTPELQQIIPYCVITNKDNTKFFVTERIAGEERLQSLFSIGCGGHIDISDGYSNVVRRALFRELNEEVEADFIKSSLKCIGTVRDLTSSTPDHLGIVFTIAVADMDNTKVKETKALRGYWFSLKDLENKYFQFESWSKYIIDYLYSKNNK